MTLRKRLLAIFLTVTAFAWAWHIQPSDASSKEVPSPKTFTALVICQHPAEDSMAHLRMEVYEPSQNLYIYHCMRNGY